MGLGGQQVELYEPRNCRQGDQRMLPTTAGNASHEIATHVHLTCSGSRWRSHALWLAPHCMVHICTAGSLVEGSQKALTGCFPLPATGATLLPGPHPPAKPAM